MKKSILLSILIINCLYAGPANVIADEGYNATIKHIEVVGSKQIKESAETEVYPVLTGAKKNTLSVVKNLQRGDADGSGSVNIFDALIVAEYDALLISRDELEGFSVADVDCNSSVDIFDALRIAQYDALMISNLDCQQVR